VVAALGVAALALGACAVFGEPASASEPKGEVAWYPDDMKELWPLVESRCTECHGWDKTAARRTRLKEWGPTVRRMARMKDSPITQAEVHSITRFLNYWSAQAR